MRHIYCKIISPQAFHHKMKKTYPNYIILSFSFWGQVNANILIKKCCTFIFLKFSKNVVNHHIFAIVMLSLLWQWWYLSGIWSGSEHHQCLECGLHHRLHCLFFVTWVIILHFNMYRSRWCVSSKSTTNQCNFNTSDMASTGKKQCTWTTSLPGGIQTSW